MTLPPRCIGSMARRTISARRLSRKVELVFQPTICALAPVLGLHPLHALRSLAEKTPKPRSSNSIPAIQSFDDFVNYRVDDVLYVPLVKVRVLRSDAPYQVGFYHVEPWISTVMRCPMRSRIHFMGPNSNCFGCANRTNLFANDSVTIVLSPITDSNWIWRYVGSVPSCGHCQRN